MGCVIPVGDCDQLPAALDPPAVVGGPADGVSSVVEVNHGVEGGGGWQSACVKEENMGRCSS